MIVIAQNQQKNKSRVYSLTNQSHGNNNYVSYVDVYALWELANMTEYVEAWFDFFSETLAYEL